MKKTIAITIMLMFVISLVPLAFAEEGTGSRLRDKLEDVKDAKEDVRDIKENVRDKAEDVRDAANVDMAKCLKSCKAQGTQQNCELKCKVADKKEDVKDAREDVKDRLEDAREKNRERLAKIQG